MNEPLGTATSAERRRLGFTAVVLFAATLAAYLPALGAGFVWDDNAYVTKPALRSLHGLWRIWSELGSTEQYYPLLHSAFWVQYHLWGDSPFCYHLLNVLLHATGAFLFVLILRKLAPPAEASAKEGWTLFAGLLFALHPVCVESVAWISEQKNTQSTVFYLLSMLTYLKYDEFLQEDREAGPPNHFYRENGEIGKKDIGAKGQPSTHNSMLSDLPVKKNNGTTSASRASCKKWYGLAFLFFVCALLSKTVTATLPAAILVALWWKRGRLGWKRDVRPLVPWFALGAVGGLFSGWVERKYIGASGPAFAMSLAQRFVLSGRAAWFYLGKLLWPSPLIFTYPRWTIDAGGWTAWLFPLAAIALAACLVALCRKTRAPLAGFLFFVGSLFPTLGFFNVYAFYFSYVADHWQYLACLGVIALAAGGAARLETLVRSVTRSGRQASRDEPLHLGLTKGFSVLLICVLGVLTWRQCGIYRDKRTLYTRTIEANPGAWMAYNNLGNLEYREGRLGEAVVRYREALRLNPDLPETENNWGLVLLRTGRLPEALPHFRRAIGINPSYAEAYVNLGVALNSSGRPTEAIVDFEAALHLAATGEALIRFNLGNSYEALGRFSEAIASYRQALRLQPNYAAAHCNLGLALAQSGDTADAIADLRQAIAEDPSFAPARRILREVQSASPSQ